LRAVLGEHLHVASVWGGTISSLGCNTALAQNLSHQAIFEVGEAGALFEVVLRQEHIPQIQLFGALLEVFEDGRVGAEAFLDTTANLSLEDGVGGDTFFLDKLLDL